MRHLILAALGAALLAGCKKDAPPPLYEAVAVERRDIVVSAEAAGSIEPILVVDVKSRASGTILQIRAETGDIVRAGDTIVVVDKRDPNTALAQATADMEVAQAQLSNADAAKRRADQMFAAQVLSEQEHEAANLTYANARAQLVRAQASVQNARDQLTDTDVRAPITGTIIAKSVEAGQVIASATRDVSGGTVLLRMADLGEVQVRALVDETDIGKIQPGLRATITVDAYPNRPFEGSVLKIEPQSVTQQNVTMFPVLIRINNEQGLLRPGMNAEVEVHIGQRQGVLAIPNAALRTARDVASAAQVLGLDPRDVDRTLAVADSQARGAQPLAGRSGARPDAQAGNPPAGRAADAGAPERQLAQGGNPARPQGRSADSAQTPRGGERFGPGGQGGPGSAGGRPGGSGGGFQLPDGVTREMLQEIRRKRESGEALTPQESLASAGMQAMRQRFQQQGGGMPGGGMQGGGMPGGNPSGGQPNGPPAGAAGEAPGAGAEAGAGGMRLPPGVTQEQATAVFAKMRSGQTLSPQEQSVMSLLRAQFSGGSQNQRRRFGAGNNYQFGGSYIVFVRRGGRPVPVRVRTGLTDLDYSEVVSGLTEQDTVLLLPSASLVQAQQEMRQRFNRMTGGGGLPGMRNQETTTPSAPAGGAAGAAAGPPRGGNGRP